MSLLKISIRFALLVLFTIVISFPRIADGASVYAIPKHFGKKLNSYAIWEGTEAGKLEYLSTYELSYSWPVGVTIDTESNILFVTFESLKYIELIDARTFLKVDVLEVEEASNLAGVILDYVDPNTTYLYTVDRATNKLFVYDWDAEARELTLQRPDPNDPDNPNYPNETDYYTLRPEDPNDDPVQGIGLAMDPCTSTLYVSQYYVSQYSTDFSSVIYAYDTEDFTSEYFPLTRTIDLNDKFAGDENYAVDISVDSANGWLYAGGYKGHDNLIRFDLEEDDPNDPDYKGHVEDIGGGVIGLAVYPGTSYLYLTTYAENSTLQAWDINLPFGLGWSKIDSKTDGISGPAGVCVAAVDFVKPFTVEKADDVNGCVPLLMNEQITYTISYDFEWTEEDDPEATDFYDVKIVDYLPVEVDFVSADPCNYGSYDPNTHSYTWNIDPNITDDPNFYLVVELNNKTTPGEDISNLVVEIESNIQGQKFMDFFTLETTVCDCSENKKIIYVDVDASGDDPNGSSWATSYTDLDDALDVAFPCDEIWVAEGTYCPNDVILGFPLVNYVGVFGGFVGNEDEQYERDWAANETILSGNIGGGDVAYCVVSSDEYVKAGVLDGFTVKDGIISGIESSGSRVHISHNKIEQNVYGIYCEETSDMTIQNNWIYDNDYGIYFSDPCDSATVVNNTFANNNNAGIYLSGDNSPVVSNCIFAGHTVDCDLVGCYATYSYMEYPPELFDPCDPNISLGFGLGNIDGDPNDSQFVYGANDDYHLLSDSACIDAGDPNGNYSGQRDIDKHLRVIDGDGDANYLLI